MSNESKEQLVDPDALERVESLLRAVGPDDVLVLPHRSRATYGDLREVMRPIFTRVRAQPRSSEQSHND